MRPCNRCYEFLDPVSQECKNCKIPQNDTCSDNKVALEVKDTTTKENGEIDNLAESFKNRKPDIGKLKCRKKILISRFEDIKVGHEIGMRRKCYKHHGVIIQIHKQLESFEIVHISGTVTDFILGFSTSKAKATVGKQTLHMVDLQNDVLYDYGKTSFKKEVVIRRAELVYNLFPKLGQKYDVLKMNCQHLASYLVTGVLFSKKLEPNKTFFTREEEIDIALLETLEHLGHTQVGDQQEATDLRNAKRCEKKEKEEDFLKSITELEKEKKAKIREINDEMKMKMKKQDVSKIYEKLQNMIIRQTQRNRELNEKVEPNQHKELTAKTN